MDSIDAIFTQKLSNELNKIACNAKISRRESVGYQEKSGEHNSEVFKPNHINHDTMLQNNMDENNSPITLSNNSSNSNSDDENISNNLSNSFELRYPEFSRSPTASRPEIFAFSEGTPSIQEIVNNHLFISNATAMHNNDIHSMSQIAKISGREAVGDRENSGEQSSKEFESSNQNIHHNQTILQMDIENETDMLIAYFKCQKYIYEQSGYILQHKSTILHSISLSLTIGISIIISFINSSQNVIIAVIVSNMSICIVIMIAMYIKPESQSVLYLYISKQFDYISESLIYVIEQYKTPNSYQRGIILQDIEKKYNNIIQDLASHIPYEIKKIYPICCNIAIFSFIKKINNHKQFLLNELRKIKMEINFILQHYSNNSNTNRNSINQKEKNRLQFLLSNKEVIKTQLKYVKNAYAYMIEIVTKEYNHAEYYKNNFKRMYFSRKKYYTINYSHCNPFVDEYLDFIIPKKHK